MEYHILVKEQTAHYMSVLPDTCSTDRTMVAVAMEDGELFGLLAINVISAMTWELPFVWVENDARRTGVARTLYEMMISVARAMGISVITASVMVSDDNDGLLRWLKAMYFEEAERSAVYSLRLVQAFVQLERHRPKHVGHTVPLSEVKAGQWNALKSILFLLRSDSGVSKSEYFPDPGDISSYDMEKSFLWMGEDQSPGGCVLLKRVSEGYLVTYLAAFEDRAGSRTVELLCAAMDAIYDDGDENVHILFHAFNPRVLKLARALVGDRLEKTGDGIFLCREM